MVKLADLSDVVRGTAGTNPVRTRAIGDLRAPKGGGGVLGSGDEAPIRPRPGPGPGRLSHLCT